MTRYYTSDGKLFAIKFCGDRKATLWLGAEQRQRLFDAGEEIIVSDYGIRFTKEEFIAMLLALPLASEEEMQRRFDTTDLSIYETEYAV